MNFDKQKLIDTIRSNKEKYEKEYLKVLDLYKACAIVMLANIMRQTDKLTENGLRRQAPTINIHVNRPNLRIQEYENAIDMLLETIDDEIELDTYEFCQYIKDEWSWSNELKTLEEQYNSVINEGR